MSAFTVKQNKKGTFVDLSNEDIASQAFIENFSLFTSDISRFLSGSAVSLILPENFYHGQMGADSQSIINELKQELNKNNISIKSLIIGDKAEILAERSFSPAMEESTASDDKEVLDTSSLPETLYVEATLRSGQLIRYPGNVFVLGDVNPSAEIIAAGDIIIWGTLRGIAHAGADGDYDAKVIVMRFKDGQIRIADRVFGASKISKPNGLLKKIIRNKADNLSKNPEPIIAKIYNKEITIERYF